MSVCVCVSVCLSVCAIAKHPLPGELKKIWSKAVSLIFAYIEYIYIFFVVILAFLDHSFCGSSYCGGIKRGGSVAVAVIVSDK